MGYNWEVLLTSSFHGSHPSSSATPQPSPSLQDNANIANHMCTCEPTPQAEPAFKPWLKPTLNEPKARGAAARGRPRPHRCRKLPTRCRLWLILGRSRVGFVGRGRGFVAPGWIVGWASPQQTARGGRGGAGRHRCPTLPPRCRFWLILELSRVSFAGRARGCAAPGWVAGRPFRPPQRPRTGRGTAGTRRCSAPSRLGLN